MYAIYLRKSRNDDPDLTIDDVLNRHYTRLLELAARLDIPTTEIDVYKEIVSGESLRERLEMQTLLAKIEKGLYKGVLVVEIERLARGNNIDQGLITQTFKYSNTKIYTPSKTYDPSNEYDNEFFEFGLFMSRREYNTINRRLQAGKLAAVKEGYFVSSVPAYGYKIKNLKKGNTLEPDEIESEVVKLIFELAISEGLGTTMIAKRLDSLGISPRHGNAWSTSTIKEILSNPVYIGKIRYNYRKGIKNMVNREEVKSRPRNLDVELYDGKHEGLIDEESFNLVQEKMLDKSIPIHHTKELKNPLTRLIYCGYCGKAISRKPDKRGALMLCKTIGCSNIASYQDKLEKKLLEALSSILKEQEIYINNYAKEIKKEQKNMDIQIKTIEKEILKLDKQFTRACELLETDVYTKDVFIERTRTISEQKEKLNKQLTLLSNINKQDKVTKYKQSIPILQTIIATYPTSNPLEKNRMLKQIIKRCTYTKAKGGRWDKEAEEGFSLEIELK